jgi:hypothetical protein
MSCRFDIDPSNTGTVYDQFPVLSTDICQHLYKNVIVVCFSLPSDGSFAVIPFTLSSEEILQVIPIVFFLFLVIFLKAC